MPRYRVCVFGSHDGLIFPDLLVTYSSGLQYELKVKQGELVPVELFNSLDIKKSLLTGSLKNYIEGNAVKVEYSDYEQQKRKRKHKKTHIPPVQKLPSIEEEKLDLKTEPPKEIPQSKPEEIQFVDDKDVNFNTIETVEDFSKLSYFKKTSFAKQSKNKSLLTELLKQDQLDSHIKNTIIFHLSEF